MKLPPLIRRAVARDLITEQGISPKEAKKILEYMLTQPEAIWCSPVAVGRERSRAYYRTEALKKILCLPTGGPVAAVQP